MWIKFKIMELLGFLKKKKYLAVKLKQLPSGHICVKGLINNVKATFILDTGAGGTVIDEKKIKKFDIQPVASKESVVGAVGGMAELKEGVVKELTLQDAVLQDVNVYVMDIYHVNNAFLNMGLKKVDGIIGADILSNYNGVIDYKRKMLYLKKEIHY